MIQKLISVVVLAFLSTSSLALTVTSDCSFGWEYAVEDENKIDGYQFIVNGEPGLQVDKTLRTASCEDVGIEPADYVLSLVAYNATGESAPSNELVFTFVDAAPSAPAMFVIKNYGTVIINNYKEPQK